MIRPKFLVLLLAQLLLTGIVVAQRCDTCNTTLHTSLPPGDAIAYTDNYQTVFRRNASARRSHPKTVEISRKAFLDFLALYFADPSKPMSGINVFLLSGRKNGVAIPGQESGLAINIAIAPRDTFCRTVAGAMHLVGNSMNGRLASPNLNPEYIDGDERDKLKVRYNDNFRNSDVNKKKYTQYVFMNMGIVNELKAIFTQNPNIEGLAVCFATYGTNPPGVCGLLPESQITVVLAPIINGKPNHEALFTFFHKDGSKQDILSYNHGSLCPNYCSQ